MFLKKSIFNAILTAIFLVLGMNCTLFASNDMWEQVYGVCGTEKVLCLEPENQSNIVYLGTSVGLKKSLDGGEKWEDISLPANLKGLKGVCGMGDDVFISAEDGVYIGKNGKDWVRVFQKQGILGLKPLYSSGKILFWTEKFLYILDPGTSASDIVCEIAGNINCANVKDKTIYVASGNVIYTSNDEGKTWVNGNVFRKMSEEPVIESEEDDRQDIVLSAVRNINTSGDKEVCVATKNGVVLFDGEKRSRTVGTTGLPQAAVIDAVRTKEIMLAATSKKVFVMGSGKKTFTEIFSKPEKGNILGLIVAGAGARVFVLTDSGVFRKNENMDERYAKQIALSRNGYPDIRTVQKMAITYADVHPDKIKKWQKESRVRALVPKVGVNFSRSEDENIEIYTSANTNYSVCGPNESGTSWGVNLSWELADLIWSDSQTGIDVRSRLMVEQRDDILQEVTRLYYEREKLVREICSPEAAKDEMAAEKMLRVEELTAYLDAFTGGRFSDASEMVKN